MTVAGVHGVAKADRANLRDAERQAVQKLARYYLALTPVKRREAVAVGKLVEMVLDGTE
ncbi:hypothetical protein [Marinivivus vitaminiproducens]|uniref:hypothetical protein n=1 Tax=Marinivivus vitaminiproducens TaxID=3035935 RepID=UPI00279C155C|nr:hypothetical protein P4R82_12985 [Geminicoccaceae bacterium SCSIO 64248]